MSARTSARYAVVDLFAGASGLGEGFASYTDPTGARPYRLLMSVENDPVAWESLYLRHFLRQFSSGFPDEYYSFLNEEIPEPDWARLFPRETMSARNEALRLELGKPSTTKKLAARVGRIRQTHGTRTILVGGPPCQGYSLVGRARNVGRKGYDPEQDPRLTLYRHYIKVLALMEPAAFVMENVRGILSSSRRGKNIFSAVCRDLETTGPGYTLCPLTPGIAPADGLDPTDFIVRAENHGIPQARHRVIVVGIRSDLARQYSDIFDALTLRAGKTTSVAPVLDGMPVLRSLLSRGRDTHSAWLNTIRAAGKVIRPRRSSLSPELRVRFEETVRQTLATLERRGEFPSKRRIGIGRSCPPVLRNWILDERLRVLPNNDVRGHMPSDVQRYFFAAVWAAVCGESPTAPDFPRTLAPNHRNWTSGAFVDRFRVQLGDRPSRTITSHISRDGHYYIHPDPTQCRSLTVREAARLQTFPDSYLFRGSRTAQYIQVGNAVPPLLAHQIAGRLWNVLGPAARVSNRRKNRRPRPIAA